MEENVSGCFFSEHSVLESSYGNIPSCSWPNHSSDVVKWSSRG